MRQHLSLSAVLLVALGGCVTPPPPAQEDTRALPPTEQQAPSPSPQEAPAPAEQEALSAPVAEGPGVGEVDPSVWATSPEGIDFLEAVFRYELEDYSTDYDGIDFIVLGLKGPEGLVELSPALLSRFVGYPNVNASKFDGRGVVILIKDLRVISESTIQVETSTQRTDVQHGGSSGGSYRYERRDGQWMMAAELWTRIS
jgi:hypothetical protein